MGGKGIEIVGMDVQQLLDLLNKAFADEWLAYYQYYQYCLVQNAAWRAGTDLDMIRRQIGVLSLPYRISDAFSGRTELN